MIEVIKDKEVLAEIADAWNLLEGTFQTPILTHEWSFSCANAFTEKDDLRVVIVHSNSKVNAIAPLVVMRRGHFEYLELLGNNYGFPGKRREELKGEVCD